MIFMWLFLKLVPKEPADRYERMIMKTQCKKCYRGSIELQGDISVLVDGEDYQTVTQYWEWVTCPCCRGGYEDCPICAAEAAEKQKKDYGWD